MNNQVIRTKPQPWCPSCGKRMFLYEAGLEQHFASYWRCSEYPDCLGTRDILLDGKPDYSDEYLD